MDIFLLVNKNIYMNNNGIKKAYAGQNKNHIIRPKTYYISSEKVNIDNVEFNLDIFDNDKREPRSTMIKINVLYRYAPSILSRLNILHEGARIYSKDIASYERDNLDININCAKIKAPIKYTDTNNMYFKSNLELIRQKMIYFLCAIRSEKLEYLYLKYTNNEEEQMKVMRLFYNELNEYSEEEIDYSFNRIGMLHNHLDNRKNPGPIDENLMDDDQKKKEYYNQLNRLIPRITNSTEITKLGSKKDNYINEKIDMKTFYDTMSKKYKMNKQESEYFYQCNMLVRITSYVMPNHDNFMVSFRPDCSKLEYKLNKAVCKRVIRKERIEKPIIMTSLSI